MEQLQRHHHFRTDLISSSDRLASLEARVVSLLTSSNVPDSKRDSSIAFELKHQAGVAQCGRILAAKRGLDVELATAGALLHDIYVIVTGSYEDHARRGGPIANDLLDQTGSYQPDEKAIIDRIIVNHSDKHIFTSDAYTEFGKDADVLDCFLYPDALDEYLLVKPLAKAKQYFARAKSIWADLGVPVPAAFNMLDDYVPGGWLYPEGAVSLKTAAQLLMDAMADVQMHPFALIMEDSGSCIVYASDASYLHATSGSSGKTDQVWPEELQIGQVALFWPGLAKYEILSKADAIERGIIQNKGYTEKVEATQ
jgi:uncharacterized protein